LYRILAAAPILVASLAWGQSYDDDHHNPTDRHHERHTHQHNPPHATDDGAGRFFTSRTSPVDLPLPNEEDAFFFVVFGDRTGGPDEGVAVLKDAVRDVNLLEPDFVITVGDLIQGYNRPEEWMSEMREFKGVMDELICPWFPVAGNHDTYWRPLEDPDMPVGQHDENYEMHFGPLWYAFEHKGSLFIALYSDEGNPETGEKNFRKPESQRMSPEQFAWLEGILDKQAKDAQHVFLFLHHPRWRKGGYGDDWDRVHELLTKAGNVRAVFAGHIHQMTYDGPVDGIEYLSLATVGGGQSFRVPRVGHLHHFNTVTVRDEQIAMAAVPVGEFIDPRELTDELKGAAYTLAEGELEVDGVLTLSSDGRVEPTVVSVTLTNPTEFDADVTVTFASPDSRWSASPDHTHGVLRAGSTRTYDLRISRLGPSIDDALRAAEIAVDYDLLTDAFRYELPTVRQEIPVDLRQVPLGSNGFDGALRTGANAYAMVESSSLDLPDGPFTVECWMKAEELDGRTGLICKTEGSEFGIFVNDGVPDFAVHMDGRYYSAKTDRPALSTGVWTHIAGVYDGKEVRVYVDGKVAARTAAPDAPRTRNSLPLMIGADVRGNGTAVDPFHGLIDEVRITPRAVYTEDRFNPRRPGPGSAATVLRLPMDANLGHWLPSTTGPVRAVMTDAAEIVARDR
jgi:hypothetical protein